MKKEYEISVIIPIYNGEKYIDELIKNIYEINIDIARKIEIVIINDGSIDSSDDICKTLIEQYKELIAFQYILKENGGIASARQLGIQKANGKFITFIDQDDKLVLGYSSFLELINRCNIDVLITHPTTNKQQKIYDNDTLTIIEDKKELLYHMIGIRNYKTPFKPDVPYTIWNCIFRADVINQNNIKFHKYISYEDDAIFLMENISKANKIAYIEKTYYFWNIHNDSESHKRKCIKGFYIGYKNLVDWVMNFSPELKLKENKTFQRVAKNRLFMETIYNATGCNFKDYFIYRRQMKQLIKNEKAGIEIFIGTRFENLLLFLAKYRMYMFVYLLNRFVFKYKYSAFPMTIYGRGMNFNDV